MLLVSDPSWFVIQLLRPRTVRHEQSGHWTDALDPALPLQTIPLPNIAGTSRTSLESY